jgi:ATP phosphoribosyltransferase
MTHESPRSASCDRKKSPPTLPKACLTWASPDVTGLKKPRLRLSPLASFAIQRPRRPIRLVLAVPDHSPWQSASDLPDGVRISTEYVGATTRYFAEKGIRADVRLSYGATEAKVPDIADAVVEITETGSALRAAGLRIIETVLTSYTELVANADAYADPAKRKAMMQLKTLLDGVMEARGKVLLKLNVSTEAYQAVLAIVPSMGQPTVSPLAGNAGYAIETVVAKKTINTLIPDLVEAGATAILEVPISKIVA